MANHLANLFLIWVISLMSLLRLATITLKSAYTPSGVYGAEYLPSVTSFAITFGSFLSFLRKAPQIAPKCFLH